MLYQRLIRPLLFKLDCEQAHHLAHSTARSLGTLWPLSSTLLNYRQEDLHVHLAGVKLANPVGLAAGFDKNGMLVSMLGHVGFGFAEIGSVTARAKGGNPKPRLFRLPKDEALINRMGLNGDGADVIAARLSNSHFSLPVGVNIAKTNDPSIKGDAAVEDMLFSFRKVKDLPLSYVTVNASCPNTADGIMEEARHLGTILSEMAKCNANKLPVFVKLSPDSSRQLLDDLVGIATACGVAGFVCGNTSTSRENLATTDAELSKIGPGGLSGRPLKPLALALTRQVFQLKKPDQCIIAVGGIKSASNLYEFIRAGAVAAQVYTALVYEGPGLPKVLNSGLSRLLKRDGLTLAEAVGLDSRVK